MLTNVMGLFGSMNLLLCFNFHSSLIAIDFNQNCTFICTGFCTHIFSLMLKIRSQEEKHVELLKAGKQAKHRLEELAPEIRLKGKGKCWHISLSLSLSLYCFLLFESDTLKNDLDLMMRHIWITKKNDKNHQHMLNVNIILIWLQRAVNMVFPYGNMVKSHKDTLSAQRRSTFKQQCWIIFDSCKLNWTLEWRLVYTFLLA